jgi:two-component system, OmpR family, phosphate regulon sensor histidine kinase PhoR
MHWWIVAVVFILFATAFYFRQRWLGPWQKLEELVAQIARGQSPRTFLVSGNRHAWRIGVALEDLLNRQQQLDHKVSQESAEISAVFAALTDALVVLDAGQRVRFCNPAFEQLFGRVAAGAPIGEIVRDADISETIRAALEKADACVYEINRSQNHFQLVAVPIVRGGEKARGVVAVFHDISRLKQTDEIRRDFVANVSHELRTPLSIFRGNLEALLEDENMGREESRHIYSTMKRHSDRLNRLVEELLTLARLEAKETKLQFAPVDAAAFLDRVARDWSKRLSKKNLRLEVQTENHLPPFQADEFRLEQVMQNLLDNAVNYSPEGGKITVTAAKRDAQIVLSVADEGVGISPDDLPRIFERFYRADKARSRELGSTGLGLSIVKHIAQLHGGDVRAESDLGKGTTVHVAFPAAQ